jgi:hypothetical protein
MDLQEQTDKVNLSAEQKLDHIFKSITEINSNVRNLNSTVEELKNEQTIIKASLNQQIRDVCREMLIAPVNNQQINLSTNSQSVNSIESNNTKKRFRASSSSNDENDNNRNFINNDLNSNNRMIGRKGIYGSKELTNFKTGIVPFNVYVGNVHLDTKDEEVIYLFHQNNIQVINQCRIDTRSKYSKAYRITITKDKSDLIKDSELWPKGLILNRFTFSKEEKIAFKAQKLTNNNSNSISSNRNNIHVSGSQLRNNSSNTILEDHRN